MSLLPLKRETNTKPPIYRPISLTCICCKLMEHIVTKHVMNHLENNKILYELQHGFRHNRSCETQLLSFIQELSETDNKNIQTDLIIMDFAKTFDKVPHRRLLYKLNYYGISGPTLHWISAFLTNRTQTVVIDGKSSSTVPVTSGVPQGTVLDPSWSWSTLTTSLITWHTVNSGCSRTTASYTCPSNPRMIVINYNRILMQQPDGRATS